MKFLSLNRLSYLWSGIKKILDAKADTSHTHTKSQISDFPNIPTKISQLDNDSGFKTTDTTYDNATQSAAGLLSAADKKKLDGIAENANHYTHPSTHSASMITEDSSHRFVMDTEKASWNNKVPKERTINGKPLSTNITLTPENIGALSVEGGVVDGDLSIKNTLTFGDNIYIPANGTLLSMEGGYEEDSIFKIDTTDWIHNQIYFIPQNLDVSIGNKQNKLSTIGSYTIYANEIYADNIYGTLRNYGKCNTEANVSDKIVTLLNFSLTTGATIKIIFKHTNNATEPTLNISSTGAKAMYFNGTRLDKYDLKSNTIYEFMYDGTYWQLISNPNKVNGSLQGLVPRLPASNQDRLFLSGDGNWSNIPVNEILSRSFPIVTSWTDYLKVTFDSVRATNVDDSSIFCLKLSVLDSSGESGDVVLRVRAKYNSMYEWVEIFSEPPLWLSNSTSRISECISLEWNPGTLTKTSANAFLKVKSNYDNIEGSFRVIDYTIQEKDSIVIFSLVD